MGQEISRIRQARRQENFSGVTTGAEQVVSSEAHGPVSSRGIRH